jgi:hypothetical protein
VAQAVLQPLEHLFRLFAQGIDLGDLAAGVVGVFVDQFFQRGIGLGPVLLAKDSAVQFSAFSLSVFWKHSAFRVSTF